jgi:hypothetical protein
MERTTALFEDLDFSEREWRFLDIGIGYLTKAFFADGLEQLLWHITAFEALFGESNRGVTERLARRLAAILGGSEEQRKDVKKRFEQLYRIRSKLVHGAPLEDAYVGHLREARSFARQACFGF